MQQKFSMVFSLNRSLNGFWPSMVKHKWFLSNFYFNSTCFYFYSLCTVSDTFRTLNDTFLIKWCATLIIWSARSLIIFCLPRVCVVRHLETETSLGLLIVCDEKYLYFSLEAAVPPWVGYNEEETIQQQILALSAVRTRRRTSHKCFTPLVNLCPFLSLCSLCL